MYWNMTVTVARTTTATYVAGEVLATLLWRRHICQRPSDTDRAAGARSPSRWAILLVDWCLTTIDAGQYECGFIICSLHGDLAPSVAPVAIPITSLQASRS